jgi:hypothetical protein
MQKNNRIHHGYLIRTTVFFLNEIKQTVFKNFPYKLIFSLLFMFVTGLAGIQAQPLYVKLNTGAHIGFDIDHIQSITFPQSNIAIRINDGSTSTYPLADVQYLSFSDYTSVFDLAGNKNANIQFYPNPATKLLHLTFRSEKSGNVQLSVINLQGKVIIQQNLVSKKGLNYAALSLSQLKEGIYLLHIQNQRIAETIKFIKN